MKDVPLVSVRQRKPHVRHNFIHADGFGYELPLAVLFGQRDCRFRFAAIGHRNGGLRQSGGIDKPYFGQCVIDAVAGKSTRTMAIDNR